MFVTEGMRLLLVFGPKSSWCLEGALRGWMDLDEPPLGWATSSSNSSLFFVGMHRSRVAKLSNLDDGRSP
jgi:hypothetical protein